MHSDPQSQMNSITDTCTNKHDMIKSKPKMTSSEYSLHSSSIIKSFIAKAHKAEKI